MSLARTFTTDDFEQEPRGPRLSESWRARNPLDTPLGKFEVELDAPPDDELLRQVNELVAVVREQYDAILTTVYEHYVAMSENRHWMKSCEVPRGLREHQVTRYVRNRSVSVRRDRVVGTIFISPKWDPEHGISLGVENGQLVAQPD